MNKQKNIPTLRFPEFEEGWEKKKLIEVAEIGRGKSKHRPRDAEFLFGGKYPFIQTGDIRKAELYLTQFSQTYSEEGLKQSKLWEKNTLCITIAANIAETAILKIEACFPDSIIGLIPRKNETIVLFVKHLFDKFKIQIQSLSQGAAQDNLNQEKLSKIEFGYPSISEQNKIANFLSAVDEKLQALKRKKSLLEDYKKGVMQQLFRQPEPSTEAYENEEDHAAIKSQPSKKSKKSPFRQLRFKREDGGDFPDWEVKKLGDIANFRRGSFPQPYGLPKWYDDDDGMPFIQVFDVDDNMLLKSTTKNKISALGAKQSVYVEKGTLIITIQGSIGRIAKTQYGSYVDRTLLIFQSYKFPIEVDYFKYAVFLLFEIEKTKAPGGTIKTITKEVLTEFNIPVPCVCEQTKIANFLSALDDKINGVQVQIEKMEVWKKGLLQSMFV